MVNQRFSHGKTAPGQSLKYLTHWPSVNIKFEDIIYTVENGSESKSIKF